MREKAIYTRGAKEIPLFRGHRANITNRAFSSRDHQTEIFILKKCTGAHSMIPPPCYACGNHPFNRRHVMKQAENLTAGTIISETVCWSSITRPVRIALGGLKEKIAEHLRNYRSLFFTLVTILLYGGLFMSGSYLFLVQLATHGW